MRRFSLVLALVLLISCVAATAQDYSRVEVFGGYSYARNQMSGPNAFNFQGWNGEATINGNRYFGITADFSGHYKMIPGPGPVVSANTDTSIYHFLFGPQVRYRGADSKTSAFARFLVGGSHINMTPAGGTAFTDTQFTYGFGGGMDLNLTNRIGARLFQADYIRTHFNSKRQNDVRLSFGVTFNVMKVK
jgi:Outer membrane protein beta-barrel domain